MSRLVSVSVSSTCAPLINIARSYQQLLLLRKLVKQAESDRRTLKRARHSSWNTGMGSRRKS
jgi:hypothetical protein